MDGIISSNTYCSMSKRRSDLLTLECHTPFRHDNDDKHTSQATVSFVEQNRLKVIQSPEPVEHLWGIHGDTLSVTLHPGCQGGKAWTSLEEAAFVEGCVCFCINSFQ